MVSFNTEAIQPNTLRLVLFTKIIETVMEVTVAVNYEKDGRIAIMTIDRPEAMNALNLKPHSDDELAAQITEAVDRLNHDRFPTSAKKHRYLMGRLMNGFAGRVDGCKVARWLTEALDAHRGRDLSTKVRA